MILDDGEKLKPTDLRRVISTLVERIELDPLSKEFRMKYRLPLTGVRMASPRGFEPRLPP